MRGNISKPRRRQAAPCPPARLRRGGYEKGPLRSLKIKLPLRHGSLDSLAGDVKVFFVDFDADKLSAQFHAGDAGCSASQDKGFRMRRIVRCRNCYVLACTSLSLFVPRLNHCIGVFIGQFCNIVGFIPLITHSGIVRYQAR